MIVTPHNACFDKTLESKCREGVAALLVIQQNECMLFFRHYTDSNRGFKSQSLAC